MSFMRNYIIFFSFIFFLIPVNTYAYLDPGTGSFVIQIIIAFALGAIIFIKIYFKVIKDFFSNFFSKKKSKDEKPNDLS
ncbi:MAG: hypothetical protein HQ534_05940 [Armatimonadetes bacterium]|nr:hypothetical protein [Armatimonadota bacterium]